MTNTTEVWITDKFTTLHCWRDAPNDVDFLRHPHRHVFHVKVWIRVAGEDREVEFFQAKRDLAHVLTRWDSPKLDRVVTKSCEMFASEILDEMRKLGAVRCEVSEDGENGAIVSRTSR